jgi:hypothetical protein
MTTKGVNFQPAERGQFSTGVDTPDRPTGFKTGRGKPMSC